jgi:hypothetical protein
MGEASQWLLGVTSSSAEQDGAGWNRCLTARLTARGTGWLNSDAVGDRPGARDVELFTQRADS